MTSRLNDNALANHYLQVKRNAEDFKTVCDYLMACLAAITERRKKARESGAQYKWNREYEALHAAVYVLRILLVRENSEVKRVRIELAQRGYTAQEHIEQVANER